MYDSNGLWNKYVSPKLKIIVINNGGGGIFRIIEGPQNIDRFEDFIETENNIDFKDLAKLHDLAYFEANDTPSLEKGMNALNEEKSRAAILEIKTPRLDNDKILMKYFDHLN